MKAPVKDLVLKKHPEGDVTQWFGENPELYARWGLKHHNGIDIVRPHGEPMYAVEDGYIVDVKLASDGFGKHVRLRSSTPNAHGHYRCWVYGHCSNIRVVEGAFVKAGDHIANMGNTGFVVSGANPWWKTNPYAGTHLHLGMRFLVPDNAGWKYPGDTIRYHVYNYNNGVKGAVDPRPWLEGDTTDVKKQQMLTIISLLNTVINLYKQLLSKKK